MGLVKDVKTAKRLSERITDVCDTKLGEIKLGDLIIVFGIVYLVRTFR